MNEVEVCYLNERCQYLSRKTVNYNTHEQAIVVFGNTMKKFIEEKTSAIITLRKFDGKTWTLQKCERT